MPEFRYNAKDPQDSKIFLTLTEVENWAKEQLQGWKWISELGGPHHPPEMGHLRAFYQRLEEQLFPLIQACSQSNENEVQNKLQNFAGTFSIPASSAFAQAIKKVAVLDPESAGQALRVASKQIDPNQSASLASGGPTILMLFRLGILPHIDERPTRTREKPIRRAGRILISVYSMTGMNASGGLILN